jgi:D-serine deaminase-like pyridoxal phosphate-dependent protein
MNPDCSTFDSVQHHNNHWANNNNNKNNNNNNNKNNNNNNMSKVAQIRTPTLLVDKTKCLANVQKMAAKAKAAQIRFRPHCKTHASLEVAKWMRDAHDVTCITVSSLSMAEYFANGGEWIDITVAFPVNILEVDTIQNLASKIQLNLLVENMNAVDYLEENLVKNVSVGIYLKIDCGYGRTGIPAKATDRIDSILERLKSCTHLQFLGFLTHAGHSYHCHTKEELYQIHKTSKQLLLDLKQRYIADFPNLQLSVGDTPTCSVVEADEFQGVDELRPGNFVFYDLEQESIGSCTYTDIAVAVACPIVAKHVDRRELTLYGGGVHFSKQGLVVADGEGATTTTTTTIYGRVVRSKPETLEWGDVIEGMYIRSLSQEHGMVVVPPTENWDDYQIGDLLNILPVHSCMTADCLKHKGYLTTDGEWMTRMKN